MKKADHQTDRGHIEHFQQIINVGPASESDFLVLGFNKPQQLIGKDPWNLYRKLCRKTETLHDPCVLDVLMASIDYMNGNPPQQWWKYTAERKERYSAKLKSFNV